jgi:hypothetical protein
MATNLSGWEQILGGVLGIGIPDRAQITGQTWLIVKHNAPADPSMHQIWAANWQDGKNAQSIAVYLNPALYAAGGAWDTFLNAPPASLSGVSAGQYGSLPISPPTFTDAQQGVASVASWLSGVTQRLSGLSADVSSGSSGFQGSGGQTLIDLLTRLRDATDAFHTQMTSPVAYSDSIAAAGDSAARFLTSMWSAYTSWTQAPPSTPLGAVVQVLAGAGGDPRHTSYGDLTTDAAWAAVENAAKSQWLGTLIGTSGGFGGLDPLSQNALSMLENQYATTTHVLDPLLGPASGPSGQGAPDSPQNAPGQPPGTPGNGAAGSGGGDPGTTGGPVPGFSVLAAPGGGGGVPGGPVPVGAGGGPVPGFSVLAAPGGGVTAPGGVPGGPVPVGGGGPVPVGGGPVGAGGGPVPGFSVLAAPGGGVTAPGGVPGGPVPVGAGGGPVPVSSVLAAPGGAGGGTGGVPGGIPGGPGTPAGGAGPAVRTNVVSTALPGAAPGVVPNGGAAAVVPLAPAAGGAGVQSGVPAPSQSLPAQAALLVPTALLASGTAGTSAGSGTRGAARPPGPVSSLGGLLAASQLGALSGALGSAPANRRARRGAPGASTSGQDTVGGITAGDVAGGIATGGINSAPVAGFSLGGDLNGPVLHQSAVPALAVRPGPPTVTVTAFNRQAVPGVPALPGLPPLPGGGASSPLGTLAMPGGGPPGGPGVLATAGGGPPDGPGMLAAGGAGAGMPGPLPTGGGTDTAAMSGAGGEAGMAAAPMLMMPGMMGAGYGGGGEERARDAFLPQDEEYWGTEPGIPGAPLTPDGQDDPEPDWPDDEYSPFEAIGIGAGLRTRRRRNTESNGRMR